MSINKSKSNNETKETQAESPESQEPYSDYRECASCRIYAKISERFTAEYKTCNSCRQRSRESFQLKKDSFRCYECERTLCTKNSLINHLKTNTHLRRCKKNEDMKVIMNIRRPDKCLSETDIKIIAGIEHMLTTDFHDGLNHPDNKKYVDSLPDMKTLIHHSKLF